MSNETKQDVFDDLLEDLADAYIALDGEGLGDELTNEDKQAYLKDYDAALPDDLPVIPEAVSDHIKESMENDLRLDDALMSVPEKFNDVKEPISGYAFYRAWLLGVWRVEETGEIVKLEAEK